MHYDRGVGVRAFRNSDRSQFAHCKDLDMQYVSVMMKLHLCYDYKSMIRIFIDKDSSCFSPVSIETAK